jgi:hypothetical protein
MKESVTRYWLEEYGPNYMIPAWLKNKKRTREITEANHSKLTKFSYTDARDPGRGIQNNTIREKNNNNKAYR